MGQELIGQKVRRFKQCNEKFYPFIEKVLMRLPEEICFKGILDDSELEIVSFRKARGFQHTFDNPIRSIIALNESMVDFKKDREDKIVYGIVHEIAHKIGGGGETGLREMEAENLSIKWGFKSECQKANHQEPKLERKGFQKGSDWARENELSDFEEAYTEWVEEKLAPESERSLIESALYSVKRDNDEILFDPDVRNDSYRKGLVYGIMNVLKERKEGQRKGGEPEQP